LKAYHIGFDQNKFRLQPLVENFIYKVFENLDAEYQILEIRGDEGESIFNIGE